MCFNANSWLFLLSNTTFLFPSFNLMSLSFFPLKVLLFDGLFIDGKLDLDERQRSHGTQLQAVIQNKNIYSTFQRLEFCHCQFSAFFTTFSLSEMLNEWQDVIKSPFFCHTLFLTLTSPVSDNRYAAVSSLTAAASDCCFFFSFFFSPRRASVRLGENRWPHLRQLLCGVSLAVHLKYVTTCFWFSAQPAGAVLIIFIRSSLARSRSFHVPAGLSQSLLFACVYSNSSETLEVHAFVGRLTRIFPSHSFHFYCFSA